MSSESPAISEAGSVGSKAAGIVIHAVGDDEGSNRGEERCLLRLILPPRLSGASPKSPLDKLPLALILAPTPALRLLRVLLVLPPLTRTGYSKGPSSAVGVPRNSMAPGSPDEDEADPNRKVEKSCVNGGGEGDRPSREG